MILKKEQPRFTKADFGLYIHIPFCLKACHYCDFYKVSYDTDLIADYMNAVVRNLELWVSLGKFGVKRGISSVFIGGGTPSLVNSDLYKPIFDLIKPLMNSDIEVTLEANVDDIDFQKLESFKKLGINRLSLGVQSFSDESLLFLKRRHDAKNALTMIKEAIGIFPNLNVDLIYGIPVQTEKEALDDVLIAIDLGVPHLSLYCLTYESATPLGKKLEKGRFIPKNEEQEFQMFKNGKSLLHDHGYLHEEVSNFAKIGFSCRHNWLYWKSMDYIGLGASSHGYLSQESDFGIRYSFPVTAREYADMDFSRISIREDLLSEDFLGKMGALIDNRDKNDWVMEFIWCGLRTDNGVDIRKIIEKTQMKFSPTHKLQMGLDKGILTFDRDLGLLKLSSDDWFLESAWTLEVSMSFVE